MKNKTTIQIDKSTLKMLQQLRITKRDTYDEIIVRLINKLR